MSAGDAPERGRPADPLLELRFALAESDATPTPARLRARVVAAAAAARPPGRSVPAPDHISGAEVFRRMVVRLDDLLGDLAPAEWHAPALRDLDVQGLVGHLIGVEEAFAAALDGTGTLGADDHVNATQPTAAAQASRPPASTHRDWFDRATATIAAAATHDPAASVAFYGVTAPLDAVLVVRAFEMWIHEEDIRRATDRPLIAPDGEQLARMIDLVVRLLPDGVAATGHDVASKTVRLVLTGPGGGTWDVNLDGAAQPRRGDVRVVVDGTEFCRVAGNRSDLTGSGAIVRGDREPASVLFAGAANLALD